MMRRAECHASSACMRCRSDCATSRALRSADVGCSRHEVGGRFIVRAMAARSFSSSATVAANGTARVVDTSARRHSSAAPGGGEEHDDAEDRGEAIRVPEVDDDRDGGEEQREQQAAEADEQQRELPRDAVALLGVLDGASSSRVRSEAEQRVGEPRERAPQRLAASRSVALAHGRLLPAGEL